MTERELDVSSQVSEIDASREVEITALNSMRVQSEENASIAREIHDRVAHGIMAGILRFDLAEEEPDPSAAGELRAIGRSLLSQALSDAQAIATGLRHPRAPESLHATVEEYVGRVTNGTGIRGEVTSTGNFGALSDVTQEHVFLLVREAVRNAITHADPSHVDVSLAWKANALTAEVCDDGSGFELFGVRQGALGLVGMKERADVIGARLRIVSENERGTSVSVEVPYDA